MPSNERSSVRWREYRASDFPLLCELDRMCFPEGIAYTPEEIGLGLAQPGTLVLVAECQEQVVAFVLASLQRRGLGHIVTIDVHPEFRRRGIGDRLMDLAEQRLKQGGAARLILEVAVQNKPAIAFYKKRGFVPLRVLPRYYRDRSDAYLLEKAL